MKTMLLALVAVTTLVAVDSIPAKAAGNSVEFTRVCRTVRGPLGRTRRVCRTRGLESQSLKLAPGETIVQEQIQN